MIYYRISELMLPTLIQRYDKNLFIFDPVQKRDYLKFYRLLYAPFYDCINTIYQFMKPLLDKKCLFLRIMEPLIIDCVGV